MKCVADIVFVIDAGESMRRHFVQLCENIKSFVRTLAEMNEKFASIRLGLLAYNAVLSERAGKNQWLYRHLCLGDNGAGAMRVLYGKDEQAKESLFTRTGNRVAYTDVFFAALDKIECAGMSNTCLAIDCATDFPFGLTNTILRNVILFTDKTFEDSVWNRDMQGLDSKMSEVLDKLCERHIRTFAFCPNSHVALELAMCPRSIVRELDFDCFSCFYKRNHAELIREILRWTAVDKYRTEPPWVGRAVFGQDKWGREAWV